MFCNECGHQINDKAVVCTNCGVAVDGKNSKNNNNVSKSVIIIGYILSMFIPLLGFVVGGYTLIKGRPIHGIFMFVVSLFMCFFWAGFINAFV